MITVFHLNRDGTLSRVATVNTADLEVAWYKTNSIDWNWWQNEGVVAHTVPCRSSQVGDIFYTHGNGKFYEVASVGFDPVKNYARKVTLTFGEFRVLMGTDNV